MRLWQDDKGAIITDEQLLRYIAYRGSLSDALEAGDVRLTNDDDEHREVRKRPAKGENARLSDYLS